MRAKAYWIITTAILLSGALAGQGFIKAEGAGVSAAVMAGNVKDRAVVNNLAVLWTSGEPEVAQNVCFMYTATAKRKKWFDKVVLIVWGPSAKLLAENAELQAEVKEMMRDGVDVKACIVCAKKYRVVDDLRKFGIEVKAMGRPLTRLLKSQWQILTF